ncbi:CMRF35-like molecule 9 isoform X3 [Gracilinanus agilis]|uniref:CMRF35-like molecule 9 isoform X3 n=1 Tax=Gracilinanus agilis TaxID=191870 RepID=UPI001CFDD08B|nr:CMRF35-like molecule 9 isoform X3 [Gracilinanus agilis]
MMRFLLLWSWIIIPGYGAMVGPKEVSGPEGSSLSVQCFYEDKHQENNKYWCKVTRLFFQRCVTIITTESGKEETNGKTSIMDNPQSQAFTVIMRNLTLKDTGKYQCGISRFGVDEVFEVTVEVFSASSSYHPKVNVPTQEKIKPTTFINVGTRTAKPQWKQETFQTRTQQDAAQAVTSHHRSNDIKSKSRPSIPLIRILAPCIILLLLLVVVIGTLLVLSARRKKGTLVSRVLYNRVPEGGRSSLKLEVAAGGPILATRSRQCYIVLDVLESLACDLNSGGLAIRLMG